MPCLFCDIVSGKIACQKVHEDEHVLAFRDIRPQAPVHVLVIPKRHITGLLDLTAEDDRTIGEVVRTARDLARNLGLGERGFRPGLQLWRRRWLQRLPHPRAPARRPPARLAPGIARDCEEPVTQPSKPDPTEIAGRYLVVQKLGAGAFGTVYKAKDKILGRMVAIKTIRLDGLAASSASLEELLKRFQREAQVSALLKHQNIVTVYDIGEAEA